MQPVRYSINVTLDGCCDHEAMVPDAELHRHATNLLAQADALIFGRTIYEMMESAWRPLAAGVEPRPDCADGTADPAQIDICGSGAAGSGLITSNKKRRAHHPAFS